MGRMLWRLRPLHHPETFPADGVIVTVMVQPLTANEVRHHWPLWPVLSSAVLAALIAAAAILLSYRIEPPPDHARVIVDEQRMTYASTPCVVLNKLDRELIANRSEISDPSKPLQLFSYASEKTMADIKADAKWSRDTACDYITGFDQLVPVWMRLIGYRSRWTADGQWRW